MLYVCGVWCDVSALYMAYLLHAPTIYNLHIPHTALHTAHTQQHTTHARATSQCQQKSLAAFVHRLQLYQVAFIVTESHTVTTFTIYANMLSHACNLINPYLAAYTSSLP